MSISASDHVVRNMAWPAIAQFPESLILLDVSNKIVFMNKAAREKFNITPELNNESIDVRKLLARAGDASSYQTTPLLDDSGTPVGSLLLFGVSAGRLNEYASKLEGKVKELDQFAYIVSHDLKAPLRAIGNLTSWIREDLEGSLAGDSKQNMDLLISRVNRMEALINGILEYSRVGRMQVKPEFVDVQVLLTEVVELLAPPAHVSVNIASNMPSFVTPRIFLSQVFSNLISNAIKHNDKSSPVINIGCSETGSGFEFFVEDNGPGIEKEHHEKIFVIFQTLQSRDKFESTGVGLTIVKRIVEDQGGRIRVESTPGKGSKFIFTWPVQERESNE